MQRLLLLTLMLCVKLTFAQSTKEPFKKFGFQIGANTANMNFNLGSTATAEHTDNVWKTGMTFGFILYIPLASKLTLQSEYSFTHRNGSDNSLDVDYSSDYLTIPLLLKYQVTNKFSFLAGPQVELLINAKSINKGTSTDITHQVEERSIGITGGFEYDFINPFFLSLRYFQGLNNIGIFQRSDVKEFKFEVVTFTAGIKF